jgi:hypothetical protein
MRDQSIWKDGFALLLLAGGAFMGFIVFKIRYADDMASVDPKTGIVTFRKQNYITLQSHAAQIASMTAGP